MARSSGGGSRSGGSRSGGSRSSSSSSSGRSYSGGRSSGTRISTAPFVGARKFRYYRNGTPYYIYSNEYLPDKRDPKPRWFLVFFYVPFLIAIFSMLTSSIALPQKPLSTYVPQEVKVLDEADVFTAEEEKQLTDKLKLFGDTTGVTTQIITVDYDKWTDNGTLENYALSRYHVQFNNEDSWVIVYSEQNDGAGEWEWEGIQGDNTIKVMDACVYVFNQNFQSYLTVDQVADPYKAFDVAFDRAITAFENQKLEVEGGTLGMALGISAFIFFHGYMMIFAGTKKKYSYKELEEVPEDNAFTPQQPNYSQQFNTHESVLNPTSNTFVKCRYCDFEFDASKDRRCPNCNALDQ